MRQDRSKDKGLYDRCIQLKVKEAAARRLKNQHEQAGRHLEAKAAKGIADRCGFAAMPYFGALGLQMKQQILRQVQEMMDADKETTDVKKILSAGEVMLQ